VTAQFVPARIPLTDPRTGLISREWYLFFQQFMDPSAGSTSDDTQLFASAGGATTAASDGTDSGDDQGLAGLSVAPPDTEDLWDRPDVPANLFMAELIAILGYTPANKAGEAFGGAVSAPTLIATTSVSGPLLISTGGITAGSLPVFANDAAAGAGGLVHGQIYQTATGEVRIKL
jgi:hypothetical protein